MTPRYFLAHYRTLLTNRTLAISLVALLFCLGACTVGNNDDDNNGGESPDSSIFSLGAETNASGIASVSFSVPNDTTKFAVSAEAQSRGISFTQLSDSNSTNFLEPNGEQISLSPMAFSSINSATAPVRDVDPNLSSGVTYSSSTLITASANDDTPVAGQAVTFTVNTKVDSNLRGGRMRFNILYVGDVGQTSSTKDSVSRALGIMRNMYSGEANISLDVTETDIEGPTIVPAPFDGADFYQTASAQVSSPAVNLFIAGDIEGSGGDILGMSAGIPGPPNPSRRSAVAVSITTGAGPDGVYSEQDIQTLGETLAHETGHFLGLEHPVEFDGNTVFDVDALADTPVCSFLPECLSNSSLTQNLLFPFPVADGSGGFVKQDDLTSEQRSLMNRYVVVD